MKIFIELHALLWNCEKLSITIVRLVFCTICDTVHPFTHPSFRCLQHQLTMDGGRKPLQAQREHANVIQKGQRRSQNTQQQLNLHIVTMSGFSPHNDPLFKHADTRSWNLYWTSETAAWMDFISGHSPALKQICSFLFFSPFPYHFPVKYTLSSLGLSLPSCSHSLWG